MGGGFGKWTGRMAAVLAVVAGLLSQGCILEKKTIIDAYSVVQGVPVGVSFVVSEIGFGGVASYCIPAGSLAFNVKLSPFDPALTTLLVVALLIAADGTTAVNSSTVVNSMSFPLEGGEGRFKGKFDFPGLCVLSGQTLRWEVTGPIPANSTMTSKVKYKATSGD